MHPSTHLPAHIWWRALALFAVVLAGIAAVDWPALVHDAATAWAVAIQVLMTAVCVGGWFSLLLVFDPYLGEPHAPPKA